MCVSLTLPTKIRSFLEDTGCILCFCSSLLGMHRGPSCKRHLISIVGWIGYFDPVIVWSPINSRKVSDDSLTYLFSIEIVFMMNKKFRNAIICKINICMERKLLTEIWECPAQGIKSETIWFVEEGKDSS